MRLRKKNYKKYRNIVFRRMKLDRIKMSEEQKAFRKLLVKNKLSLQEMKCVIALAQTKYTPDQISRIFIYKDI